MSDKPNISEILELTTEIVSAHVSNNLVAIGELPSLIQEVYKTMSLVGREQLSKNPLRPAVPVNKSIFPDYIICLDDGKKLKMLKRHIMASYSLSPKEYRDRWGLVSDYPMVAPNYAKHRSNLAKKIGLGTKPRTRSRKSG
jgi:predicted transcriptional regulator